MKNSMPLPRHTFTALTGDGFSFYSVNKSRVAQVSLAFWVIKILTTGMGETLADYLDHRYSPILVVVISGLVLTGAIAWQFAARHYSSTRYWFAVVMVSVFGTLAADAVHVALSIPYWASSMFFAVALALVFVIWAKVEPNLAMSRITTRRAEFFYWAAVMATFALGTAAGDWIALGLGLGFLAGTFVFTVGFALPLLLGRMRSIPTTLGFWLAYTFTRPMGASFADWLALPPARGGIGLGTLNVSLIWIALILVALIFTGRPLRAKVSV